MPDKTQEPTVVEFTINGAPMPTVTGLTPELQKVLGWMTLLEAVADEMNEFTVKDRLISLARTDLQSAVNWLTRYMSDNT